MTDIDTRMAFGLRPRRLPVYDFPMKTGMVYDPQRKVLHNFYPLPLGYYVIRKNANMNFDDGLYTFSGDQEVQIYDGSGFYVMFSADVWMTELPVYVVRQSHPLVPD